MRRIFAWTICSLLLGQQAWSGDQPPLLKIQPQAIRQAATPQGELAITSASVASGQFLRTHATQNLAIAVTVRNNSNDTRHFLLRAEIEGITDHTLSPPFSIGPRESRIYTHTLRAVRPGDIRTASIRGKAILLNSNRTEIMRSPAFEVRVAQGSAPPRQPGISTTPAMTAAVRPAMQPASPTRDLAVRAVNMDPTPMKDINIDGLRTRSGSGVTIIPVITRLRFGITLENTGKERWGYAGSISANFRSGTPETGLNAFAGTSGVTRGLPGGIAPGQRHNVIMELSGSGAAPARFFHDTQNRDFARPGMWLTLEIIIHSEHDQNPDNNRLYYVFMLDRNGRVAESRTVQAGSHRGVRVAPGQVR